MCWLVVVAVPMIVVDAFDRRVFSDLDATVSAAVIGSGCSTASNWLTLISTPGFSPLRSGLSIGFLLEDFEQLRLLTPAFELTFKHFLLLDCSFSSWLLSSYRRRLMGLLRSKSASSLCSGRPKLSLRRSFFGQHGVSYLQDSCWILAVAVRP